jgi:hypothetical protein
MDSDTCKDGPCNFVLNGVVYTCIRKKEKEIYILTLIGVLFINFSFHILDHFDIFITDSRLKTEDVIRSIQVIPEEDLILSGRELYEVSFKSGNPEFFTSPTRTTQKPAKREMKI